VEGSFDKQRIYGLRSSDKTINIIRKYSDKKDKIRFFQMNKQEHDHRNVALNFCNPGDWYWTVDSDEIYKFKDLKKLHKILYNDNKTDLFRLYWDNFYYNFKLYLRELSPPRIFRTRQGCKFIRRNTMATSNGILFDKLNNKIIKPSDVLIYHYGYITNVRQKIALYGRSGLEWYNNIFKQFTWENRNKIYRLNAKRTGESPGIHFHGGGKLKPFKGKHPNAMINNPLAKKDLLKLFASGEHEDGFKINGLFNTIMFIIRYIYYGIILKEK
jgi:hypothetical protein